MINDILTDFFNVFGIENFVFLVALGVVCVIVYNIYVIFFVK